MAVVEYEDGVGRPREGGREMTPVMAPLMREEEEEEEVTPRRVREVFPGPNYTPSSLSAIASPLSLQIKMQFPCERRRRRRRRRRW